LAGFSHGLDHHTAWRDFFEKIPPVLRGAGLSSKVLILAVGNTGKGITHSRDALGC
jgi:hypothetical protein